MYALARAAAGNTIPPAGSQKAPADVDLQSASGFINYIPQLTLKKKHEFIDKNCLFLKHEPDTNFSLL
jgi:hypothetical protein